MKDISIITHKLAETIRDMITLGEINKDYNVTFKDTPSFVCATIYQYPDFSESNLIVIRKVFEDVFKDTEYFVKVSMKTPKTIVITVLEKE